ncbi:S1C family serine protease [Quadrisphaera sp. DSM 44207]|uniref:S1C family serine protease n=1 Tax=Quadrisphaera sp. DSM 44207 TaxID=1881057 RepID=UPI00088AAD7B|nr:serine protease [Quadrisphaera sp. DSM 44207]SDQ33742.1 Trypsin-like peptidase domain-containing protein [Quadrisphaera sp. DSM 44207]
MARSRPHPLRGALRARRAGGAGALAAVLPAASCAALLAGCAVPRPPQDPPSTAPSSTAAPSTAAPSTAPSSAAPSSAPPSPTATEAGTTQEDGARSPAGRVAGFDAVERAAVRVRNVRCGSGIATGSGFAVDERTLITNQHVVEGAEALQVSTYDGQELTVSTAGISTIADLAVVRTDQELPSHVPLAAQDPSTGDPVSVVGFPLGGPMTKSSGQVLGMADDPIGAMAEQVVATDVPVEHGSSGSALLDATGEVVGVVYAGATAGGQSYAVPVSVLSRLLAGDAPEAAPSCG